MGGIGDKIRNHLASALLVTFILFMGLIHSAVAQGATTAQVETKISFLETLLGSSNAAKVKQYQKGRIYAEVQSLLQQSKAALAKGDIKQADALASRGFVTFTDAVKRVSRQNQAGDQSQHHIDQYKTRHRRINHQYLQLNAISTKPSPERQAVLDKIAHHLSTAERLAGRQHYLKALDELDEAEEALAPYLPRTQPAKTDRPKTAAAVTPTRKKPEPVAAKPVTTVAPRPPAPKKAPQKPRSPKELYLEELRRYQRYEARITPTLESERITEEAGLKLLNTAQATRDKADRAKGQAIDGNYTTALRILREASRELKAALASASHK